MLILAYLPLVVNSFVPSFCKLQSTRSVLIQDLFPRIKQACESTTALYVSEVHIPGYRQTKLPFILSSQHLSSEKGGTLTPTNNVLSERSYATDDYSSLVSYQDGHLVHKTNQPLLTPEECQLIIDEAEKACEEIGWTTSRHGNYP